jgi:hypothetical protein
VRHPRPLARHLGHHLGLQAWHRPGKRWRLLHQGIRMPRSASYASGRLIRRRAGGRTGRRSAPGCLISAPGRASHKGRFVVRALRVQVGVRCWQGSGGRLSPDLRLKAGEGQYLDHVLEAPLKPLKTVSTVATSTTTPPCAPPPSHSKGALTVATTVTALHNALTSSHKRSTMRRASRQILSRYL